MKVLVLGAGGAASNGFARALRLAGGYDLVGANCSETDLLLSECETNHLIAPASYFEKWKIDIDHVIRRERPDFVHAQNDGEVEALGLSRQIIHLHGVKTFLPAQNTIRLCRDKWASYVAWRDAGIRVPETLLGLRRWPESAVEVWIRPCVGAGGQRSLRTSSPVLAERWIAQHGGAFTVARALTADTVTVQQLYWRGDLVCSQQRTRASWANAGSSATGVSGSTGIGVTSSDREADEIADRAVAAVDAKPHGLYGIDMCRDEDGTPCPTEINIGRFFTTVPEFFAHAGFNIASGYVTLGSFGPDAVWGDNAPSRNPLADGLRWIRGMDREPVLDRSQVRDEAFT